MSFSDEPAPIPPDERSQVLHDMKRRAELRRMVRAIKRKLEVMERTPWAYWDEIPREQANLEMTLHQLRRLERQIILREFGLE